MKKTIQISIPAPCHENWQQMTPVDKGRFCASCQKEVFDFTNSSDREIASALKNTENACGRFSITQLNRDLIIPKEKSTMWMAASAAVMSFLSIGTNDTLAQTPIDTVQREQTPNLIPKETTLPKTEIITGTVWDEMGIPAPGVNVNIEGTSTFVLTDFDGQYSIPAKIGDKLSFSYISFEKKTIIVSEIKNINIKMHEEKDTLLVGLIIIQREKMFRIIDFMFR